MTSQAVLLALAVFGAAAVEAVEALTIVLAAGVSRGWRSALEGSAVAVCVLAVLVAAVGVPLLRVVPIDALRVIVGAMLLVLGLQWLRKAILRASGLKPLHDEDAIYVQTVQELSAAHGSEHGSDSSDHQPTRRAKKRDATAFTVAFKGVFLEGLEVVLIVLSLGLSSHRLGLAALAAAAAVVLVSAVGVLVARQLSEVPENAIKTAVGIMLTSFGLFWVGEGAGLQWPGGDLWILVLVGWFSLLSVLLVSSLRRRADPPGHDKRGSASGASDNLETRRKTEQPVQMTTSRSEPVAEPTAKSTPIGVPRGDKGR